MDNLDRMMRIISALIAKADDPAATEEESATYRAKAEDLMRKYRIEEEGLIAADQFSIEPVLREVDVASVKSAFYNHHSWLWRDVARHCGVRYTFTYRPEGSMYVAQVVGYDSDIRYAEFLFSAAKLMMIAKLEPDVNPNESDKDNIYRLRSAGIDRQRIAEMVWGKRGHQEGLKVGRLYKEACADRGEDAAVSGRNVNAKTYRIVYAEEFERQFRYRLNEARNAADSIGGAITLHGRAERVDEAFYTRFPNLRPKQEDFDKMAEATAAAKKKGRAVKSWTNADEVRWQRFNNTPAAQRAKAAGTAAASMVQIERVARARRVESTPESNGKEIGS